MKTKIPNSPIENPYTEEALQPADADPQLQGSIPGVVLTMVFGEDLCMLAAVLCQLSYHVSIIAALVDITLITALDNAAMI